MTAQRFAIWDSAWDQIILWACWKSGLARLAGSRDAIQQLRLVILEQGLNRFRDHPLRIRRLVLYRRALDEVKKVKQKDRSEVLPTFGHDEDRVDWSQQLLELGSDPAPSVETIAAAREAVDRIVEPRDKAILRDVASGRTQREIAARHGISRSRVQQILMKLVDRLTRL